LTNSVEKIKLNWEKYEKLCGRLSDDNINDLVEFLGERILMCPASMRDSQYNSEPGGLVEHSLNVAFTMRSINDALSLNTPVGSILKVGLLHEIGKVGDENHDCFVDQDSDWHREKLGQNYKYNEEIPKMSVSHRTLYLLQQFGVKLSRDEWIAIQIAQGSHFEENRFYVGSETTLGILLQKAKSLVIHEEMKIK